MGRRAIKLIHRSSHFGGVTFSRFTRGQSSIPAVRTIREGLQGHTLWRGVDMRAVGFMHRHRTKCTLGDDLYSLAKGKKSISPTQAIRFCFQGTSSASLLY